MLESESAYTCLRGEDFTMSLRDQEKAKKQGLLVGKQKREIQVCFPMLLLKKKKNG